MAEPKPITLEYVDSTDYAGEHEPQPFAVIGTPPGGGAVESVNTKTGVVVLDATDVSALPADYVPAWNAIIEKPAVIAAGDTQADARAAIGAGTSNLALGATASTAKAGNYQPSVANITDASTVGKAVLTAADAAAARTAIGAGTSSLALGTTATTAKAGNYTPTAAEVSTALKAKAEIVALTSTSTLEDVIAALKA